MSMMLRRGMMVPKAPGGLPDEYLRVQYLESPDRADMAPWIDTGVKPNESTVVQLKFMNLATTGDVIFGYSDGEQGSWRIFNSTNQYTYLDLPTGSSSNYRQIVSEIGYRDVEIILNEIRELEFGNHYVKSLETGTIVHGSYAESYSIVNKTLTLNYYNNSKISKNRWYYVKIYEGARLIRDMIPCIRIADSKPGMYDLVGRQFYVNQGTGEFIAGWTLLPEQDGKVEKAKIPVYAGAHIHMEWDTASLGQGHANATVMSFYGQSGFDWRIMNPDPACTSYIIISKMVNTSVYNGGYVDFDVPVDSNLFVGYWQDSDQDDRRIVGSYINIQIS